MKRQRVSLLFFVLLFIAGISLQCTHDDWIILFDGHSTDGWRAFQRDDFPHRGWEVVDGCLKTIPKPSNDSTSRVDRMDIVTKDTFRNFVLELEWRVSPGGNSGVFYHVREDVEKIWHGAPEMQVLDDTRHKDGKNPKTTAGALYGLLAPTGKKTLVPVGEFNHARIIVQGNHAEHWLNHRKILEYTFDSEELKARIAASKFADKPLFMKARSGHIALQHHGDEVWYRNIRIRRLPD